MIKVGVEFKTRLATTDDIVAADAISSWINHAIHTGNSMLPKSPDILRKSFGDGLSMLTIAPETKEPIAHVSLYPYCRHQIVEVGGAIRKPGDEYRGAAAVATIAAIKTARELFPGRKIISLANDLGGKALVEKHGARMMDDSELTDEATELCSTCPRRNQIQSGRICCDRGYDLSFSYLG